MIYRYDSGGARDEADASESVEVAQRPSPSHQTPDARRQCQHGGDLQGAAEWAAFPHGSAGQRTLICDTAYRLEGMHDSPGNPERTSKHEERPTPLDDPAG